MTRAGAFAATSSRSPLDNYGSGPQAPYNSWVLLERVTAVTIDD